MAPADTPPNPRPKKLFISCVSAEFRSYRLMLANHLAALAGSPFEIKVQEDFRQGGGLLLDSLAATISECDAVIHLAGDAAGWMPTPEHEAAMRNALDPQTPIEAGAHSYTQWEYHLAKHLHKPRYVYIASPAAPRDWQVETPAAPQGSEHPQSPAQATSQRAHLTHLQTCGEHYTPINNPNHFLQEVCRDLDISADRKPDNLPFRTLGSLFKGREEFLTQIKSTLGRIQHEGHVRAAAITNATAASVHGLGGVGKTRAAIEYAHQHASDYSALLFVQADSPSNLKTNLAALCGAFVLDLPEKDAKETQVQLAAVVKWLRNHPGWFLILDNVDTEEAAKAVEEQLASFSRVGQVLITSRLARWSGAVEALALDVLSEDAAADFLLERTAKERRREATPQLDHAQALTLAKELGQLALALEQAGAFIAARQLSFAEYLAAWRATDKLITWFDERLMQYPRSVAVTWQTSYDQLDASARDLLHILAWFAPDPIPETVVQAQVPSDSATAGSGFDAAKAAAFNAAMLEALDGLATLSLATRDRNRTGGPVFSVHRLVQEVTRRRLIGDAGTDSLQTALAMINAAFVGDPGDVRSWPKLDPLEPHAITAATHADKTQITDPTARLMSVVGGLLSAKARFADAEPHKRRALAINEASFGKDHPNIAAALNNLAQLLKATNRLSEAEPLMWRALAIDEASFGKDRPEVATDLNNLAGLLMATNRLSEAEPLMRRALAIDEASFGSDHPNVAIRLNNLAQLLHDINRLSDAEPLMRRAVEICENSFGLDHPNVATALSNLAALLHATNRLREAEPLMRRVVEIVEKSLGTYHPKVAIALGNLAQLLQATNRLSEAEPLMMRVVKIFEKSLGVDHPEVATALNNLAQLLKATNRHSDAEPLIRRALAIDESSFGKDHPTVAIRLNNLAGLLQDTNRLSEAEPLIRRALAIDESSFGKDHPNVASDLNNLAQLLQATNRLSEAEPLMRRALAINEASFGEDHPSVAIGLNNLAALLKATSRFTEAEPLSLRHLEIFLKFTASTGHPHPHLQSAIINYGILLLDMHVPESEALNRINSLLARYGLSLG